MLPNESLLVVFQFADYKTIVFAQLTGRRFLRLAIKYAEELARRRSFRVEIYTKWIMYKPTTFCVRLIHYEHGNQASLVAACRQLADVIGPHAIAELEFSKDIWNMPGVGAVFDAAPPLKYAEDVRLTCLDDATTVNDSDAFMQNFIGMKSLRLSFSKDLFQEFSWTFLRRESARELRRIAVKVWHSPATEDMTSSVEEFVRNCARLPRLLDGEALELDFSNNDFPVRFCLRIIELLKGTGRKLTFRTSTLRDESELRLDESEYTVEVVQPTKRRHYHATTRYASEKSGIVVEVNGRLVAIKGTAGSH